MMNLQNDPIELTLEPAHRESRRPRMGYLLIGLICIPSAFSLLLVEPTSRYWNSKHLGDADVAALIVLIVGALFLTKALASDLLRVCAVRVTQNGIFVAWSHVPQIFGGGIRKEVLLHWDEIESLRWLEGESELDLKQYLQIEFKEKIEIRKTALKVLVCDDRDEDFCKKIIHLLPPNFVKPEWIRLATQHKKSI
jgi:hypothetical protein